MITSSAEALQILEENGIECREQHTYFGTEYVVHIYGNNRRAAIYPSEEMFLCWANAYISKYL